MSNTTNTVCVKWNMISMLKNVEMFVSADQELGIPVQMLNDREKVNRCTSQAFLANFFDDCRVPFRRSFW